MTIGAARERLLTAGVDVVGTAFLREIAPESVLVGHRGTTTSRTIPADTVVIVSYNRRNRELADALLGRGIPTHVIGDAAGGQSIMAAIHDAAQVIRAM
jgi:hypothetical protein